jgi:cell fate regulator YaaT (PSP1 superfamily)
VASDNSNIVKWATEIDGIFGQIENVIKSEVVNHGKNLRSVCLYYKGTKRSAIVRVTFDGTDIAGLHLNLLDAEKEEIRAIAENFVRQICNKNSSNAILQSYKMADEFYKVASDNSNIVKWATEIDRIFGQLGNVVDSEVVEHGNDMRSVCLYYKGTKHPAIMKVTFVGTDIGGLHFSLWVKWGTVFWSLFAACCFICLIFCIFWRKWIRKGYVKKLKSEHQG